MAATLTCTPGGASDNSYVSLADADAFFDDDLRASEWVANVPDDRTRALVAATADIESLGGAKGAGSPECVLFRGTPYYTDTTNQALHFPRDTDTNSGGSVVIPEAVKRAVYEQAFWLLKKRNEPDFVDHEAMRAHGLSIVSNDGLYLQYGGKATVPEGIAPRAWRYISGYIRTTANLSA